MPDSASSSTTYCTTGLRPTDNISFGWLLVAGSNRVPWPATGTIAISILILQCRSRSGDYSDRFLRICSRKSASYSLDRPGLPFPTQSIETIQGFFVPLVIDPETGRRRKRN